MTAHAGEDSEKEEHSFTIGGVTIWKLFWQILRKLDIVLPEEPGIPLLGIYPKDAPTYNKDTCSAI